MALDRNDASAREEQAWQQIRDSRLSAASVGGASCAASAVLTRTANAAASGWQSDWAFCNALWWADGKSLGACPGNDTRHGLAPGDYMYTVTCGVRSGLNNSSDPQPDWRFCSQCYGLFCRRERGFLLGQPPSQGPPTTTSLGIAVVLMRRRAGAGAETAVWSSGKGQQQLALANARPPLARAALGRHRRDLPDVLAQRLITLTPPARASRDERNRASDCRSYYSLSP